MNCYFDLDCLLGEAPQKQRKNGRFVKGMTPHNKGKKWCEWMAGNKEKSKKTLFTPEIRHCPVGTKNKLSASALTARHIFLNHQKMSNVNWAFKAAMFANVAKGKGIWSAEYSSCGLKIGMAKLN